MFSFLFNERRRRSLVPLAALALTAGYLFVLLPLGQRADKLKEPLDKTWLKLSAALGQTNSPTIDFVGITNFIGGTVSSVDGGRCVVSSALGDLKAQASEGVAKNASVIVSVRPEDVELSEQQPAAADGENVVKAIVHAKDFLGEYLDFHVKVGDVVLQARAHPSLRTPTGEAIYLRIKAEKCVAIPSDRPASSAGRPT